MWFVHVFAVLADPVRRHTLSLLAGGERNATEITEVVRNQFGISQPATARHLRVLRESGLAEVRVQGSHHLYSMCPGGLREAEIWLSELHRLWSASLDALRQEVTRAPDTTPAGMTPKETP